jgi:glycosyltransferase involved in cell wall biosynthesis
MGEKYTVFVFARLKPSQINYKIIPLSKSPFVEKVIVLRKTPLAINSDKIECIALPKILRIRLFYWMFTSLYGAWLIRKRGVKLILSYNIFPHGFNGYVASLITGKPLIYAEIIEDTTVFYKNPVKRFLIKKILNRSKKILVPGTITGKFWQKMGFDKTFQLHSTIDPEYFKPDASVVKKYDFIFIGVFDERKRPDLILSAIAGLRKSGYSVNICMIGFGNMKQAIEKEIFDLNLTEFVTLKETNDVLHSIRESKILVMASLAEGIPCAMLESMACELIVVVPPVGDIDNVIEHGVNGFLHDNSKEEIMKYMTEAYKNYDSLGVMRANARKTIISKHSFQFAISRWNELLSTIKS